MMKSTSTTEHRVQPQGAAARPQYPNLFTCLDWSTSSHAPPPRRSIDVPVHPLLATAWCNVVRVRIGEQPHAARVRSAGHLLMIFDNGSYVHGERRVDGHRVASSGRLDVGVDFIPANAEFVGLADAGSSTVGCTLIAIDPHCEAGADLSDARDIRPELGLKGPLLQPLADLFRRMAATDTASNTPALIEGAAVVLVHEISTAIRGAGSSYADDRKGGLSGHTQRIARDYLRERLCEKVDLDELARKANLSRFHFTRAFKQSFGIPPYQYLVNLRIQAAAEQLRTTSRSITELALDFGFANSAEFARSFRRIMHCSPREYRTAHR